MSEQRTDGRAWIARMPAAVARQREVLTRLLDAARQHEEYRWVELAASLARGAGDELSDIDAALGVSDESWPGAVDRVEGLLAELAPVADRFRQAMPGKGDDVAWHLVTLYRESADDRLGVQLSLVVMPASWRAGLPPGSVALHDEDGVLATRWEPSVWRASGSEATEWAYLGWVALGDLAKYLDRGSMWEAHAALETARGYLWQLAAYARGSGYPSFGMTSVFDGEDPTPPAGIERTVAGLDPDDLRTAGRAAAGVLEELTGHRPPFGDWAVARLDQPT